MTEDIPPELLDLYLNKYPISPLYIKRLNFIVNKYPHLKSNTLIIKGLLNLILDKDSNYKHFNETYKLIKCLPNEDAEHYLNLYNTISKPVISLNNINHINEYLSTSYDAELSSLFSNSNPESSAVSIESFHLIANILKRKSIDSLMLTSITENINENSSYYYNINPDYLTYYKQISISELKNVIIFKNYDNSLIYSYDYLSRKLQQILEHDKDDCSNQGNDDNNDNNHNYDEISTSSNNNDSVNTEDKNNSTEIIEREYKLSIDETVSYWNCRWFLIYAIFLSNNYLLLSKEFEKLLEESSINGCTALTILQDESLFDESLINKQYLLRCIIFAILIINNQSNFGNYFNTTSNLKDFKKMILNDANLNLLIKFYLNCKYRSMSEILDDLTLEFKFDYQLITRFEYFKTLLKYKNYLNYLSIIKRVTIARMAFKFNVDELELYDDLFKLITIFSLNVKIDQHLRIIEAENIPLASTWQLTSNLNRLTGEILVENRAIELNSILNKLPKDKMQNL